MIVQNYRLREIGLRYAKGILGSRHEGLGTEQKLLGLIAERGNAHVIGSLSTSIFYRSA